MTNSRYLLVTHPREADKLSIHGLLRYYHWERLDDQTVLVQGSFPVTHHGKLSEHPDVTMMPHQLSRKKLHAHVKKDNHLKALKSKLSLDDSHDMRDFLDSVETKLGPLLQPHK